MEIEKKKLFMYLSHRLHFSYLHISGLTAVTPESTSVESSGSTGPCLGLLCEKTENWGNLLRHGEEKSSLLFLLTRVPDLWTNCYERAQLFEMKIGFNGKSATIWKMAAVPAAENKRMLWLRRDLWCEFPLWRILCKVCRVGAQGYKAHEVFRSRLPPIQL